MGREATEDVGEIRERIDVVVLIDRQESNVSGIGSSEAWNKLRRND
jgi:hypothetical protein